MPLGAAEGGEPVKAKVRNPRGAERFRLALLRAGNAAREELAPGLAAARERALDPERHAAVKPYLANGPARGFDVREAPAEIGLYAQEPTVFCARCRAVLSYTFACLCGSPDPAVLVPLPCFAEEERKAAISAWDEAFRRAMAES